MTIGLSLQPKLLRPGLRGVWGMRMKQWNPEYIALFDESPSDKTYEEFQEIAPFGLVPQKASGKNIAYDDLINGYSTKIVNISYGLGYKITREMIDDNLYKEAMSMPKNLANSVIQTVENVGANVFNRAFSASYVGADSKALCATDHPLVGGGTLANRIAVNADLSPTSLEQAFIDIGLFTDARGNKIQVMPKKLIVSVYDRYTASEITKSQYSPGNANNAINPVVLESLLPEGYAVNHFFTDTDAWFIRTDQEGIIMQKRVWPAEFRDDNDSQSLDVMQGCYFRLAFGWYDYRSVYGSPGA